MKTKSNDSNASNAITEFLVVMNNKKVKAHLRKLMIGLIVLSILVLFFSKFLSFILTIILVLIGSFSKIYKRFIHSIGFELVTFASIIFFFAHGPVLGFLLSLIMLIASTLLSSRITQALTFQAIIYASMAILSIFLLPLGPITAGKILIIYYNIVLHAVGIFLIHYPPHSSVINFIVNAVTGFLILEWTAVWLLSYL